ncbi:Putative serine protease HtrA [Pontiella desulfatans]|uniref:Serine protease HtrA n=2 Tax=Pontiella desulfatans TaxID=2750659 RepID=A0A6C2U7N3_PONDE|nr:Putative serine protease HtrA [Pontiella desulfatans]
MNSAFKTALLLLVAALAAVPVVAETESDEEAREKQRKRNELKNKQESQALISAQFSYGFSDVADKLVIISCKSEQGKTFGSGFVARMDGKTYIFTNQHVIMGADKISFKTASGTQLKPRSVELSLTRDIARLELETDHAFDIGNEVEMDIPVAVFGNSEGAGVGTELFGVVNGLGAELVETSAEFVSGNSGSPILNLSQEVLGIASYVRVSRNHAMKEGTKFENQTRRFCYRLSGVEWKSVRWTHYNKQYGKLYRQSEMLYNGIFEIIKNWSESPLAKVSIEDNPERSLHSWAKSHNEVISRFDRSSAHKRQLMTEYAESLKKLSGVCRGRARQISMFSEQRELTGFLREEFEKQSGSLDYAAQWIDQCSAMIYSQR